MRTPPFSHILIPQVSELLKDVGIIRVERLFACNALDTSGPCSYPRRDCPTRERERTYLIRLSFTSSAW